MAFYLVLISLKAVIIEVKAHCHDRRSGKITDIQIPSEKKN